MLCNIIYQAQSDILLLCPGEVYKVEVKEPPQGVTPPPQNIKRQQRKQVSTYMQKQLLSEKHLLI